MDGASATAYPPSAASSLHGFVEHRPVNSVGKRGLYILRLLVMPRARVQGPSCKVEVIIISCSCTLSLPSPLPLQVPKPCRRHRHTQPHTHTYSWCSAAVSTNSSQAKCLCTSLTVSLVWHHEPPARPRSAPRQNTSPSPAIAALSPAAALFCVLAPPHIAKAHSSHLPRLAHAHHRSTRPFCCMPRRAPATQICTQPSIISNLVFPARHAAVAAVSPSIAGGAYSPPPSHD